MKKILASTMVAFFAIVMVSCASINIEQETCEKACSTAQDQCVKRLAKDKEGKVSETKKGLCDSAAKKCKDECAKRYGAK